MPGFDSVLIERPGVPAWIWRSPGGDWGSEELYLRVHDVGFHWTGVKTSCLGGLHLQPEPDRAPELRRTYRFHVRKSRWPQFNSQHYSGLSYRISWGLEGPLVHFHGYYFAGIYDQVKRTAELRFADARPEVETMELANCMRLVLGLVLASEQILLLHSSAASLEGDTWVFFGPEGAGKTTLADLAPRKASVFGDDLNALILRGGRVSVACLPFGSSRTRNVNGVARATALLRIVQHRSFFLESMTPGSQSAALLGSIPFFNADGGLAASVLPLLSQISTQTPVLRLGFSRSPEVYAWLRRNRSLLLK